QVYFAVGERVRARAFLGHDALDDDVIIRLGGEGDVSFFKRFSEPAVIIPQPILARHIKRRSVLFCELDRVHSANEQMIVFNFQVPWYFEWSHRSFILSTACLILS